MLEAVDCCPAPLVARVQGYALGGGSGLVACADVVVAAPDATFAFREVRLGIIPAVISPFVFAKHRRRRSTAASSSPASASTPQTALRVGLVDEVADDLDGAVDRQITAILRSGPLATRAAKRLTRERPSDASELARIAAGLRAGDEGQEGLRAFLDKRRPSWSR